MEIDSFIRNTVTESPRRVQVKVRTGLADTLANAARIGRAIPFTDFLQMPAKIEVQEICYRHILGPPAPERIIKEWQGRHSANLLPRDLRHLVTRINGIHLWAREDIGRSYIGLAPIEEWEGARRKMYGDSELKTVLREEHVALSYDVNRESYIVLNCATNKYFLMDVAGPDESSCIARSVPELLDWLWNHRSIPSASFSDSMSHI